MEAKPIGAFHIAEQQVDGTSDYLKDGEWPIDNGIIEVYAAQPATVSVPDEIYAELYQLREEVKGPDGFNTWRDAATAEKVLRLSIERDALRYRFLRDKDAFGDENEPGLASWGDLAEMEYNEFDANVDARMNNSDIPRHSITQAQMIENDVAASEKKAPNERYKQISDIDYLGAMSAFHSDKWHKMGSITGYMHGWNACRAAMLQGSQPVSQNYKLPVNTPCQDAPAHIWLQTAGVWPEDGELSELTWCSHNQHHDDTLYVRADLVNGNSPVTPDGWISCSERMPDKLIPVMVMYEDGEMWSAMWNGNRWDDGTEYPDPHSVTHWREMPAAPKQEVKS
ncbi:TPA: DUF551 domain-containing protein [Escherichia coli]